MQLDLPHLIDLEPQLDPPMQPESPQPHDPEPQPHPTMPTSTERKQSKGVEEVPDIFDNEEEYVGVNDEHMYISLPPAQPSMNVQTDSSMPTNDANENDAAAEGGYLLRQRLLMQILMR